MKSVYSKLFKVQEEAVAIEKSATNPHFKSKYADISEIIDKLRPALIKHGLVLLQPINVNPSTGLTELQTIIADSETGDSFIFSVPVPANSNIQLWGSQITYLRRYSLQAVFALPAEDDDGESVMQRSAPQQVAKPTTTSSGPVNRQTFKPRGN